MAIEHRISKMEKRLGMTSVNASHIGEIIIYDKETGEAPQRRATGGDVSILMPDNGRDPRLREGSRNGTYVNPKQVKCFSRDATTMPGDGHWNLGSFIR
jgi:hypothetical protein